MNRGIWVHISRVDRGSSQKCFGDIQPQPAMSSVRLEVCTTPSGQKIKVNSEENRAELSRAYAANGKVGMTPVMCGFLLQAMALDRSTDAFKQAQIVAHRLHMTYEDEGMSFD